MNYIKKEMKMEQIIERYLKISDDDTLVDLFVESWGEAWNDNYFDYYGHIIYIDTKPKQVITATVSQFLTEEYSKLYFIEALKSVNYCDFNQLLLLVTTYPHFNDINMLAENNCKNKNIHLDRLFEETNGWLIYNWQLENLFMMAIEFNEKKAIEFRRNLNSKKKSKVEEFFRKEIFGLLFKDIISERMKLSVVYKPRYEAAYRLYQFLNK